MKTKDMFSTTFAHRWAGKPRAEVETRAIHFWLKNLPAHVGRITLQRVDDVIKREVEKGNKPSTINSKLQTLKTALDFTRERGSHDVTFKVPRLKQPNDARIGFFSTDDQTRIESLIDCDHFRDFFIWSIETGLRPSESLGLNFSKHFRDDPVVGPCVTVTKTKNGEPRTIPLTGRAFECFKRRKSWARMTTTRVTREWRRLRRKEPNLMRDYVFYTCRHTCATRLLSRGVNIKVVQSWMGHKDINMTLRYAKLVPTDLAAARDLMDNS